MSSSAPAGRGCLAGEVGAAETVGRQAAGRAGVVAGVDVALPWRRIGRGFGAGMVAPYRLSIRWAVPGRGARCQPGRRPGANLGPPSFHPRLGPTANRPGHANSSQLGEDDEDRGGPLVPGDPAEHGLMQAGGDRRLDQMAVGVRRRPPSSSIASTLQADAWALTERAFGAPEGSAFALAGSGLTSHSKRSLAATVRRDRARYVSVQRCTPRTRRCCC